MNAVQKQSRLFGGTRRFRCELKDRAEPFLSGGSAPFLAFRGIDSRAAAVYNIVKGEISRSALQRFRSIFAEGNCS